MDENKRKPREKRVVNSILENKEEILSRPTVRIEILSSAENTPLLDKDLHEILGDASNCCEFSSYVDKYGETFVKIDCVVNEEEKERVLASDDFWSDRWPPHLAACNRIHHQCSE